MSEVKPGDFGHYKFRGRAFKPSDWPDRVYSRELVPYLIDPASFFIVGTGIAAEPEVVTDPYEWYHSERSLNWRGAIKLMVDYLEDPFSGPSGQKYLCHTLFADTDRGECLIALSADDGRGVHDFVVVWEKDGETHVITKPLHMEVVINMLGWTPQAGPR